MNEQEKEELERLLRRMRAVTNELMAMKKSNRYRDVIKGLPILGSLKQLEQNVVAVYEGCLPYEPAIEGLIKPQLETSEELLQALKGKRG